MVGFRGAVQIAVAEYRAHSVAHEVRVLHEVIGIEASGDAVRSCKLSPGELTAVMPPLRE